MRYLPKATSSGRVARRLLDDDLERSGVTGPIRDDALLLLSELVGNAVLHGDAIRSFVGYGVGVDWTITDDSIRLLVADAGKGPPGPRRDVGGVAPRSLSTSGRGLQIVDDVADSWGVIPLDDGETVGSLVWASIKRT